MNRITLTKASMLAPVLLFGTVLGARAQLVISVPNAGSTGTTLNSLAKYTGAPTTAVVTATSDTTGAVGIVYSGAGTTGNALITKAGEASCTFDGATTANDAVQISSTVAGECHDPGAVCPSTGQIVGRVLSTNAASGLYSISIGADGCSIAGGGGGGAAIPGVPQGRITLQSGAPVQTSDQSAATVYYYDSYKGDQIPVYNGTSGIALTITGNEVSAALASGTFGAGNIYDIYGIQASGALALCYGPAWNSSTSRGTGGGTTQIHINTALGWWTNQNSLTHCYGGASGTTDYGTVSADYGTYLGSEYATASGQTSQVLKPAAAGGGSAPTLGVYNAYNRVVLEATSRDSSGWSYTPGSAYAWREADNSASERVTWLDGLAQSETSSAYQVLANAGGTANVRSCYAGLDENSTSATPTIAGAVQFTGTNQAITEVINDQFYPLLGLSYVQAMETGSSTSFACTWSGNQNSNAFGSQQLLLRVED